MVKKMKVLLSLLILAAMCFSLSARSRLSVWGLPETLHPVDQRVFVYIFPDFPPHLVGDGTILP